MDAAALIGLGLKTSIFLTVLALGLRSSSGGAAYLLHRPGLLGRSVLSMDVIMPLFAVAMVLLFDPGPAVKIALVALSLSPVPPFLPKKVLKSGGEKDYVLGLLMAASVAAILLIPVSMALLGRAFGLPLQMSAAAVIPIVFSTVLIPLLLGLAAHALAPERSEKAADPVGKVAGVLLVLSALPVLIKSFPAMISLVGNGTILALAGFSLVGLLAGHALGGDRQETRLTLAFCTASRHPGVALAIAHANFPAQERVSAAVFLYLIVNALVSALYMAGIKRMALSAASIPGGDGREDLRPA